MNMEPTKEEVRQEGYIRWEISHGMDVEAGEYPCAWYRVDVYIEDLCIDFAGLVTDPDADYEESVQECIARCWEAIPDQIIMLRDVLQKLEETHHEQN